MSTLIRNWSPKISLVEPKFHEITYLNEAFSLGNIKHLQHENYVLSRGQIFLMVGKKQNKDLLFQLYL